MEKPRGGHSEEEEPKSDRPAAEQEQAGDQRCHVLTELIHIPSLLNLSPITFSVHWIMAIAFGPTRPAGMRFGLSQLHCSYQIEARAAAKLSTSKPWKRPAENVHANVLAKLSRDAMLSFRNGPSRKVCLKTFLQRCSFRLTTRIHNRRSTALLNERS